MSNQASLASAASAAIVAAYAVPTDAEIVAANQIIGEGINHKNPAIKQLAIVANRWLTSSNYTIPESFPNQKLIGISSDLTRLFEIEKTSGLPPWFETYVTCLLSGLHTITSAAAASGIHHIQVWRFWATFNPHFIVPALNDAATDSTVARLEASMFERALDSKDKGSIPLLIFALKGSKPGKYSDRGMAAGVTNNINVTNNAPSAWNLVGEVDSSS